MVSVYIDSRIIVKNTMKGIILAAGKGTRLYPATKGVAKPLLPVYDKPLIYYAIAVLLQAGIRDILVIIPPGEEASFEKLLGDGSQIGVKIQYKVQTVARGIADAFIVGEDFIGTDDVCLVLGDNIFHHHDLEDMLEKAKQDLTGAVVLGYRVADPRPFGVVEFDEQGKAVSIEEKPQNPKSDYIIPGLYFYQNDVIEIAKGLIPSAREELEITDVNIRYMEQERLSVIPAERGMTWLDAGTEDSLLEASVMVKALQKSGEYVGYIEEIAWRKGMIDDVQFKSLGAHLKTTKYGQHLLRCLNENR